MKDHQFSAVVLHFLCDVILVFPKKTIKSWLAVLGTLITSLYTGFHGNIKCNIKCNNCISFFLQIIPFSIQKIVSLSAIFVYSKTITT